MSRSPPHKNTRAKRTVKTESDGNSPSTHQDAQAAAEQDSGNQPRLAQTELAQTRLADDNPLLWMFRRKDKTGEALIGPAAFAAGERLRADLTFAGMVPRVTMDWSGRSSVDRSSSGIQLNQTEAAIAARQRVTLALRAVGPEFSGLLMDLCGFCKGLESIERERGWPMRSAKVVIRLALASLARHYGFDEVARGRKQSAIRAWTPPGSKPRLMIQPETE